VGFVERFFLEKIGCVYRYNQNSKSVKKQLNMIKNGQKVTKIGVF
jgi:hypothetical protein